MSYVGERKNGLMHGQGVYTWADGAVYEGEWKADKRHGQGTFTSADGRVYAGEFKDDKLHGQGILTCVNGNVYTGEWKDNDFNGQGAFTWADGKVYKGDWKDNNFNNQGTFTWADGSMYKGEFKNGKRHGQGTFSWASGEVFSGTFKDDFLAQGAFTDSDSLSYDSAFTYTGSKSQYGSYIYNVTRTSLHDGSVTSGTQYNNSGRLVFTPDQETLERQRVRAEVQRMKQRAETSVTYTYASLAKATENFSESCMVSAEGAFGSVYVAQLTSNFRVAVKVMKDEVTVDSQYTEQFQNEVQLLQNCRHPHVLSLLGHCLDGPSPCLVYEYKSRGSLRGLLSARHEALSFTRRLLMLQQIASGLEYMHVVSQPPVIHRDIKTLNILVDDDWNCSIGDFGIARLSSEAGAASGSGKSTRVLGTPGYIDPEYVQSGKVSVSSDIYSFGVICLEMLTSRLAYDDTFEPPSVVNAFEEAQEERTLVDLVDNSASANWSEETAGGLIKITKECLKSRGKNRPTIVAVLKFLLAETAKYPVTSLTSRSSSQKSDISFCVICLDAPRTHALMPCGHKCLCGDTACVSGYQSVGAVCPLCRAPCTGTMRVFD